MALFPSHNTSGLSRIVTYLSFSLMTLLVGPWLIRNKPDVIYVYNLVTLSRTASFLRWLYGCKIVHDVQDLWPESVSSSGMLPMNGLLYKFFKKWCITSYQRADCIAVLSPGFKKKLLHRGIAKQKIELIYNWTQEEKEPCEHKNNLSHIMRPVGQEQTFNVVFAGTMGIVQALETVLDAAEILLTEQNNAHFFLIGAGAKRQYLKEKSQKMRLANVTFMSRQPHSSMETIFQYSDVLLVHLKNDPLFKITIPSKTQAYLAAGKPIIMAVEGDAADLVEQAGAGYSCRPEDPRALADCVKNLVNMSSEERIILGENGKKFYEREMSFVHGVDKFELIFKSVLKNDLSISE
ncbi:MAG: glycosyltransferase WbuB [Candidatus Electrothrix sp. AR3]|nr:glycosyltransferase WbuB [Candidatus Electrothrix sp. AR3]